MATSDNELIAVKTYQQANLAFLQNLVCFISTANTKFKNFDSIEANLGASVQFELPPRFVTKPGLKATFQGAVQRSQDLTVDQSANTAYSFTAEQLVLDKVDAYMNRFGKSATQELGARVEADIAGVIPEKTYRFGGTGNQAIDSYTKVAQILAQYRNYGATKGPVNVYLPDTVVPTIIGNGLGQFVPKRNEETANSWELGSFSGARYYVSNLLPVHEAGDIGQTHKVLKVVSINPAGNQITFSGAGTSIKKSVVKDDVLEFDRSTGLRYLTFIGHQPSDQTIQVRITADADSDDKGNVVVNIEPALIATAGDANQNVNKPVAAGHTAKVANSHRTGLICSPDALFIAMPKLPDQSPFTTANEADAETGVSMRLTRGSKFGGNETGMIHDILWGKTLVPEYSMRLCFPL